jgi:ADP-ribose pyrophosphatase YjhB (NUDIX family)
LPGGFQELSETPAECAVRECTEETGLEIILVRLVGVFSSTKYEWVNYPWKENVITDIVFQGRVIGGELTRSSESTDLNWFTEDKLPQLSDGHIQRLTVGFSLLKNPNISSHFE